MKKLSEVTLEDARSILSQGIMYKDSFLIAGWNLKDVSPIFSEPSVALEHIHKEETFIFYDDSIHLYTGEEYKDDMSDINYLCYLKAVALGYYVPELSEIITSTREDIEKLKNTLSSIKENPFINTVSVPVLIQKVEEYIKNCGYTWTYESIMKEYAKYREGEYISHSAKDVIQNCIIKHLIELPK